VKKQKAIDEYIKIFPEDIQIILEKIRKVIGECAPRSEEAMKYGIPTFKLNGRNLVHFAAFKNHIGFFPTPSAIVTFKKELSGYKTSKGTIQFPLNKPIPFDLVKKITAFRTEEVMKKTKKILR
jgi:uncharacterized protein YdhG (YjbR/CyaY superfamily)